MVEGARPVRLNDRVAAPDDVHESVTDALKGLSPERRTSFHLRLDRWWADLSAGLAAVYPQPRRAGPPTGRPRAAAAYAERPTDLHRLDQRRLLEPDWLQQPGMFGYACYTERFAGDLDGRRRARSTTSRTSASPTCT